jgi:hypothetical protein
VVADLVSKGGAAHCQSYVEDVFRIEVLMVVDSGSPIHAAPLWAIAHLGEVPSMGGSVLRAKSFNGHEIRWHGRMQLDIHFKGGTIQNATVEVLAIRRPVLFLKLLSAGYAVPFAKEEAMILGPKVRVVVPVLRGLYLARAWLASPPLQATVVERLVHAIEDGTDDNASL